MPARCATCDHPQVREINHRIADGRPLTDISRWLRELGTPITRQALARHAKDHRGVQPQRGRRPVSGDFLELVRDTVHEGVAEGSIALTARDGLQAQRQLDERLARNADRDLMLKVALVLTGNVPLIAAHVLDPEREEIEAEYRQLAAGPSV